MVLVNEVPLFVDTKTNKTIGYGFQCVQDISAGVDGAVWAVSCDLNDTKGNFKVIKWDPFLT